MIYLAAVALAIVLIAFSIFQAQPSKKFPPGPIQMPLIGNLLNGPMIGTNARLAAALGSKYGPILGFSNGPATCVITQTPELTTELFVKNSTKVNGRPVDPYFDIFAGRSEATGNPATGIVFATGERWKENRKFAMMKVFGKDKLGVLYVKMQEEIVDWINWIDQRMSDSPTRNSTDIFPHEDISPLTMNIIGAITCDIRPSPVYASSRPDLSPECIQLSSVMPKVLSIVTENGFKMALVRLFPFLRSTNLLGFPEWKELAITTRNTMKKMLEEREKEINAQGLPETPTILDLLVSSRLQDPEFLALNSEDLIGIMMDLFAAGTDTTSTTLSWILPQLVNHPVIKTRLIDEIDSVVGRDRACQVSDLDQMPLLDAVLNETLRRHPPAFVGIPSQVEEQIELCNGKYEIPVGTFALMNIFGMHHSTEYWTDPYAWNPQRWIDNPDLRKNPAFIPFRVGARSCLGRFLAAAEAKLILVAILQRFDLASVDGKPIVLEEKDSVILNKPDDSCRVRMVRRA